MSDAPSVDTSGTLGVRVESWLGMLIRWLTGFFQTGGTSGDAGFSDLLNYLRPVADGVMLLKDEQDERTGPLMGGWWYSGPDFESQSHDELARLSYAVSRTLRRLDIGWMLHFEAIVCEEDSYIGGSFDNAIDRLLNDERRALSGHYHTRYAFFVTQAPGLFDQGRGRKLRSALLGSGERDVLDELGTRIARFEQVLGEVEQALSSEIQIKRMRLQRDNDELMQALQLVVNRVWKRCRLPEDEHTVDQVLARDVVWSPDTMMHGDGYTSVVGLFKYPSHTMPGLLCSLTSLGVPLRWSTRFIVLDHRVADRELSHLRRIWTQKVVSLFSKLTRMPAPPNEHAAERANEVGAEIRNLESGEVAYGHWTSVVVTHGATQAEADEQARQVIKHLERRHFEARLEGFNRLEALLGSFPGHGRQNVRKPLMHTLHVADLMPLAREWRGLERCPCPFYPPNSPPLLQARSASGGAVYVNLHVGDLGHTLVLGPTSAGKSTFLAAVCTQFMKYWRSRVVVLDNGASMMGLTLARRDGAFLPLGSEEGLQLCPLAEIDAPEDRAAATEWLELVCEEHAVFLSPAQRNRLYQAVVDLSEMSSSARHRTLTDLVVHLNGTGLEAVFSYYTSGAAGYVFAGECNDFGRARFTTFELEKLMTLGPKVANPALAFIFRQIEKSLDGRPTLVVIDEAWLSLSHPHFAERLKKWLKTWRRKNCAVILATQQLDDVIKSPIADTVFASVATKILLPNHEASADVRALYADKLQLSAKQIELLTDRGTEKKRWYMYVADGKSRLFTLDLGPVQKAFLGASGVEDLESFWRLSRAYGAAWPAEYLRCRGLHQAAERYQEYATEELMSESLRGAA